MKSIKEIGDIKGKTIIVRVDFNVPLKEGKVLDPFRITATLPTITYLQKKGARVVLIAHAGEDGSQTLLPMAKYLNKKIPTQFCKASDITTIQNEVDKMKNGEVLLLENIRRFQGEKLNDTSLGRGLSRIGQYFVNDAFSVSHRAHMSIVGISKHLPSYAGFQLQKEVQELGIVENPPHPFIFILGGAKFSTKMPLIKKYLQQADGVFVGGALVNDFLKAQGLEVGNSKVDGTDPKVLRALIKNTKLCLPIDVIVENSQKKSTVCLVNEVGAQDTIVDIGPASVKLMTPMLEKAKLVLWNGPMGYYEGGYDKATKELLKTLSKIKGKTIIGGGDTVAIISKMKLEKEFTFVSTGGGATLDFLANGTLPGIKALNK